MNDLEKIAKKQILKFNPDAEYVMLVQESELPSGLKEKADVMTMIDTQLSRFKAKVVVIIVKDVKNIIIKEVKHKKSYAKKV